VNAPPVTGVTITALLPLKNFHPGYLQEAVGSLFAQTSPDWRLIVIVEPEDLAKFGDILAGALADPRASLIPNEGHAHAGAFNTGMRAAVTPFAAILLGDDLWERTAVEVLQREIRGHPGVDLLHSGRRMIDGDGKPLSSVYLPAETVAPGDFVWTSPIKHLICWRLQKALSFGGMDDSLTTAGPDDYDFPWLMVEHGAVVRPVRECLYVYRDHRDAFRHTTHIPLSVHVHDLRRILRKHGVPRLTRWRRIRSAKRHYLRQCLYRNSLDRWIKQRLGIGARTPWREPYR
jgi:glycosyltransferase involved in cell wall biosynthesis